MEWCLFFMALLFGFGAIGDKNQADRNNYTLICITCIAVIAILKFIK
ncbi:hypothetical protein [Anaerobutyricum hallii]|nr:hypothetical protein [Anaerobutyricum hallii]